MYPSKEKNSVTTSGILYKSGIDNHGHLYESQVMTFLSAKLANDTTVRSFEMLTNAAEILCFDDILLKVDYKDDRSAMYMIQIKHSKKLLQIAKKKKENKPKYMTIDLGKYFESFQSISKMLTSSDLQGEPLREFLRSVKFENYYFCIVTTISELEAKTKLSKITTTSNKDLQLLNMGKEKNCYQLDTNVYNDYADFPQKLFIFLNQPNYVDITEQFTRTVDALKHFTQPMAHDLFNLITEHSHDTKSNICSKLTKEKFIQLCVQVILCNNMSIYMLKAKPLDEKYLETWDKICSEYQIISIDKERTEELLPLLASYYEHRIRKYTEKALTLVLNSIGDQISLKNHQFTWNDRQQNGFHLDYRLREALKTMGINALNLRDLLPELWRRNEIPIIVDTSIVHIIKELGSNTTNRFFMVSSSDEPKDDKSNDKEDDGLKAFRNLLDLRDGPASAMLAEIMDIEVSLQGRPPVPLKDMVRHNQRTLQRITSSDVLGWMAKDCQVRGIGSPLKENITNYITRKFLKPGGEITEDDIVKGLKSSNLTIISNDPGMGKSTVLTSLARKYDPTRYIIICDLAQCKMDLQDENSAIHNDPIMYFFKKTQTEENALVEGILHQHLDEKVLTMFLDSFDEILPLHQKTVINVVKEILAKDAHVFITSRTQAEHLLSSTFANVISISANLAYLVMEDISDYFRRCNVPKDMWSKLPETFLSTPLHLEMLHEIYKTGEEDKEQHMKETTLYENFIKKKISIFFQKKKICEDNTRDALSSYEKDILNNHYVIALVALFGLERIKELEIVTKEKWDKMLLTFEEYKLSLGIVSTISPTIKFIHKTFAEYLVAVFINKTRKQQNEKTIELYKDVVKNGDLYQTYKFLHEMRSMEFKENTIEASIRDGKEENILEIISANHTWNRKHKTWGMYPIHWAAVCCFIAMRSRTENLKPFDILRILLQQTNTDIEDEHLHWNWLNFLTGHDANNYNFYKHLILCLRTNVNGYLRNRIEENIEMEYTDNDGCSLGHLAARNSDKEVLDYLLKNEVYYSPRDKCERSILHHACLGGNLDIIDLVIDSNMDSLESQDNNGLDALHYACQMGNQKLVEHLLNRGLNINSRDNEGRTPFHVACQVNSTQLVKYLIDRNVDINATFGNEQRSALHQVSLLGYIDIVNILLAENSCDKHQVDANGNNALHFAAKGGKAKIISTLINNGMNPNDQNAKKQAPLHIACAEGHFDATKCLLDNGADPFQNLTLHYGEVDDKNGHERRALHCAAKGGNVEIIEALIMNGLSPNGNAHLYYSSPLHCACAEGNFDAMKCLWEMGANPRFVDQEGRNILHLACGGEKSGAQDIVDFLFEGKLIKDIVSRELLTEATDKNGWTALHHACNKGNREIVEKLLQRGFNVNEKDKGGRTPFHLACSTNDTALVRSLLDNNADVNATFGKDQQSALHKACLLGNLDVVKLLLMEKSCIHYQEDAHRSKAVHYAAKGGNIQIIEALINMGMNLDDMNSNKKTPLHYACTKGQVEVVKYLLEKGANPQIIDKNGKNSLHFACSGGTSGAKDIVDYLIDENLINIKTEDKRGYDALHYACCKPNREIAENLLQRGFDVNKRANNKTGETPFVLACRTTDITLIKCLMDYGADVNATFHYFDDEITVFHDACLSGNLDVVKLLMQEERCDHLKSSRDGITAEHFASEGGNLEILKILKSDINKK